MTNTHARHRCFLSAFVTLMTFLSLAGSAGGQNWPERSEAHAQRSNPNLRILAVSSGTRSPRFPNVPSIAETYPGYDAVSWTGMFAPAGTPKSIIDKIAGEIDRSLKDPNFLALIQNSGIEPLGYGPGKFAEFIKSEIPKWGEAVEIAGVKLK